jgi:hypothetical protein
MIQYVCDAYITLNKGQPKATAVVVMNSRPVPEFGPIPQTTDLGMRITLEEWLFSARKTGHPLTRISQHTIQMKTRIVV